MYIWSSWLSEDFKKIVKLPKPNLTLHSFKCTHYLSTQDLPIMPYLISKISPSVSIVKSTAKKSGKS